MLPMNCSSNRGGKLLEAYPNGQLRIHGVRGISELELRVLIGKLSSNNRLDMNCSSYCYDITA